MKRIDPADLSAKQRESYHFHKLAAVLADFGYNSIRLDDDWQGADFIAQHLDGSFIPVQLKGRFGAWGKYLNKGLHIAFPLNGVWYLYPHDKLAREYFIPRHGHTDSWKDRKHFHTHSPTAEALELLEPYKLQ